MSEQNTTAKASVAVTLTVALNDRWGGDCPLSQVYDQAAKQALLAVEKLIKSTAGISIAGNPEVKAIVFQEDRP